MQFILIFMAIVIGSALIVALICVGIYNNLIKLRNRYKNAFSQIDVQLKRRYDLIPSLVESTKGYLEHEKETLQGVIEARNQAAKANASAAVDPSDGKAMRGLMSAEGNLGGVLSRLMAVVESYPDLKGDETVANLMEELKSTENKISFARQAFNDAVTIYNNKREVFPNIIVASVTNFQAAELFEITNDEEKKAPVVKFT